MALPPRSKEQAIILPQPRRFLKRRDRADAVDGTSKGPVRVAHGSTAVGVGRARAQRGVPKFQGGRSHERHQAASRSSGPILLVDALRCPVRRPRGPLARARIPTVAWTRQSKP
jgi:hypothetical protein